MTALTDQELLLLRLVAGGLAYKEIVRATGLTSHMVRSSLPVIYQKLGKPSKAGAVVEAYRQGLLLMGDPG